VVEIRLALAAARLADVAVVHHRDVSAVRHAGAEAVDHRATAVRRVLAHRAHAPAHTNDVECGRHEEHKE
jgi:hypothetical protein